MAFTTKQKVTAEMRHFLLGDGAMRLGDVLIGAMGVTRYMFSVSYFAGRSAAKEGCSWKFVRASVHAIGHLDRQHARLGGIRNWLDGCLF
jgi:hypothetical protein